MRARAGVVPLLALLTFALAAFGAAFGEHRMIGVGERRLFIDCGGNAAGPTVVLIAGGGRTAADWAKVQPVVAGFARVCSYDRANLGKSDKTGSPQSAADVVSDLHALLIASREKAPFVLVGHSIAGVYSRLYVTRYPEDVSGLVFVDSSHEEQAVRFHAIDPQGPAPDEQTALLGLFVTPGQRLTWHTDLPLIVLSHGQPLPRTPQTTGEQAAQMDRRWRTLQQDLARRSTHGEFRAAERSGHYIHLDQPELVI